MHCQLRGSLRQELSPNLLCRVKRLLPDLLTSSILHNFRLTKTLGNNSPHKKNSSPHVTTHEPIMRMSHESTLQKKRKEKKSQNPIHQYDVKMPLADVFFCETRCLLSHCLFLTQQGIGIPQHNNFAGTTECLYNSV